MKLSPTGASKSLNIDKALQEPVNSDKLRNLIDMALWHNEIGNVPGAVHACEAALQIDPYNTSALSLLGVLYEKQGNDEKAIETFQKVVELNPDSFADAEKLEHLLRGIRDRAVSPPLVHQMTPPLLLKVSRKYPKAAFIGSVAIGVLVLSTGFKAIWGGIVAGPRPPIQSHAVPASMNTGTPSIANFGQPPSTAGAPAYSYQYRNPQQVAAQSPVYHDPFIAQYPGILDQVARNQGSQSDYNPDRGEQRREDPAVDDSTPSVSSLKPLMVPSSSTPQRQANVDTSVPGNDHVVMVGPSSVPDNQPQQSDSSSAGGDDLPAAPASHIFINVHGNNSSSAAVNTTPVPSDPHIRTISLREDAGASLQQKGLNLQEAGNYKAAQAAYESAIAAYQSDAANGRNAVEAKRGIDACQVAVEICKQSQ
jgi:hypothetical protein